MIFENHKEYNCQITLSDSTKYRVNANWIHNSGLDDWRDWSCDAGLTRLYIDDQLDVYSGECMNDHLGNVITGWSPFSEPTVCKRDRCTGCTDDLILNKEKR